MNQDEFQEIAADELDYERIDIQVDPKQSPIRIDAFLSEKIPRVSRNKIQMAIEAGWITVNQSTVKSNYKIRPNDQIHVITPRPVIEQEIIPEELPLDIVYEDDTLIVINKRPGVVVHPAAGVRTGTLLNAIAWHLGYRGKGFIPEGHERLGLVHRIDKETSGLLLLAKNDEAAAHLSKQFFDHTIEREYLALVWGEPNPAIGRIEMNIYRDPKRRSCMATTNDPLEGKYAATNYELVESFYYTSLIKCKLETGRTHQIRVHMRAIGHTLFNDEKYGGDKILKGTIFTKYKQFVNNCYEILPHFALHARSIGFIHPKTNQKMYFELELPQAYQALLSKWRNYTLHRKESLDEGTQEFID